MFVQNKFRAKISPSEVEEALLTVQRQGLLLIYRTWPRIALVEKYLSLIYSYSEITKMSREGWDGNDLWDSEI